ncbi:MAG TPA: FtsX-like permease family protein [Aggregatilinea sp.]|uniref:FtsX-like permease family protein n=1 Tax=Aggregatilinea sp. TaxID=2806333 RepID=UPI002C8CA157|nr:FtsX-like permease family protein [Aggregatilinea sp.]HML20105.1 FtsX-like permease family protein [Aggregatilinea sp.]
MITPILLRLTQRHIDRRLFQSLLFIIGIALGVAVGVAIDLANASSLRAFKLSVTSITGRTTHQIVGTSGVPSNIYRQIRIDLGLQTSAPVIESTVRGLSVNGRTLRLLGVDPLAEAPFRDYLPAGTWTIDPAQASALYSFIAEPNRVFIAQALADEFGLAPGDTLTLQTPTQSRVDVTIVGLIQPDDELSQQALSDLVLADIATAQEIAGQPGLLTRIDLILPDGYDTRRIEAILPPDLRLTTPSANSGALSQMIDAFALNLRALSLLALLVGVFLIYNTVTFSVVQRRSTIGILRALGTTRRQIFTMILAEAMTLGIVGTILGLGLGILLGRSIVGLVAQTINDLYFRVDVQSVAIEPGTMLRGVAIGLIASFVAAIIPSYEATRTPPVGVLRRSDVEQRTRQALPFVSAGAVVLILAGVVVLQIQTRSLTVSFTSLFLVLVGCALLTPLTLIAGMALVGPVTDRLFGVLGRMAPRAVARSLSRTAFAVAALTLAVSVIVGVSVMIRSFRVTVTNWLATTLGADVYISSPSEGAAGIEVIIDPALASRLADVEGVAQVATMHDLTVITPDYPDLPPANLIVPSMDISHGQRRFAWLDAPTGDYWQALESGVVMVSEPFAYRRHISRDRNTVTLLTDRGPETFTIGGVYYDYTTDQGAIMMAHAVYAQYFDDSSLTAIGLVLEPGVAPETIIEHVRDTIPGMEGLQIQSNRALRANVLKIFDRTFAITIALRLLAIIVAFIGILSALMALQLEHTRQYGIMRANGMTPRQLRVFTFIQTGLMGSTAGILAAPTGLALALILIKVINVRSFGWTITLNLTPQEFIQAFAVALAAALAGGIYPAWRLSRLAAVQALRSE